MAVLNEARHTGEFILSESSGHRSRDAIVIASGEGVLAAGTVLGQVANAADEVTVGTPTFAGTGNGTLTKATPAFGPGVQAGNYKVTLVEVTSDGGKFLVRRPDGTIDGQAIVGSAYDGQVKFTIADGSTDFSGLAEFTIPVTIDAAGEYKAADPTATDGSQTAKAILIGGVDATSAAQKAAAITRSAEVNGNLLTYDAAVDDATKKAAKVAELKAVGIIVR